MKIKISIWIQYAILFIIIFITSAVYAAVMTNVVPLSPDLTWPLIFNGIAPGALLAFFGKRYLDKQDKTNKELIETKNDHATRISDIETVHRVRGCDQPDTSKSRRKDDRK